MLTKKDVQLESFELSFIWGKIRMAAWETATQIALRDYSPDAVGEGQSIDKVLVKGVFNTTKYSFYKRFLFRQEDLMLPWMDLVLL